MRRKPSETVLSFILSLKHKVHSFSLSGDSSKIMFTFANKMADLCTFFTSIQHFFGLLWASVARLFIVAEEADAQPISDIEAGMQPAKEARARNDNIETDKRHSLNSLTETLDRSQTIKYDHTSRRPSRRASAVDPVKSRIVDATLKQVQDRNIGVVKSVVLTPCTIIASPCTATIEYYDPRMETNDTRLVVPTSRSKRIKHGIQFGRPPTSVNSVSDSPRTEERPLSRDKDSIGDLFDLFPHPPPVSPPGGIRVLLENFIKPSSRSVVVCPTLIVTESSPCNSDAESNASFDSYGSDSDSDNASEGFSPSNSTFLSPETAIYADPSPAVETSVWLSEPSMNSDPSEEANVAEASGDILSIADELDCDSTDSAVEGLGVPDNSAEAAPLSAEVAQDAQELKLDGPVSSSNLDGLVEVYHAVVDGFPKADLQKGDIFDKAHLKEKETPTVDPISQGDLLRDILTNSPSEDAVVDFLLAQLETSFEIDEECRDSLAWLAGQGSLSDEMKARLQKHISLQTSAPKRDFLAVDETGRLSDANWEQSISKILQNFKDAEAEDLDFRDLFYRDSSFYSQSSLHMRALKDDSSCVSLDASQDGPFDDSFEGGSVEEILAWLDGRRETRRDTVRVKSDDPTSVSLSGSAVINSIDQDEVKTDTMEMVHNGDDDETWLVSTAYDAADDERESEGEDDQCRHSLGLNNYIA